MNPHMCNVHGRFIIPTCTMGMADSSSPLVQCAWQIHHPHMYNVHGRFIIPTCTMCMAHVQCAWQIHHPHLYNVHGRFIIPTCTMCMEDSSSPHVNGSILFNNGEH